MKMLRTQAKSILCATKGEGAFFSIAPPSILQFLAFGNACVPSVFEWYFSLDSRAVAILEQFYNFLKICFFQSTNNKYKK